MPVLTSGDAVVRTTPDGIKMDDGFRTKIAPTGYEDIAFWEKSVTPPGLDGEEKIDTTTMWNDTWRTFAPRQLITMTPISTTVAYDAKLYTDILAIVNVNLIWTVSFPLSDQLVFWAALRSFTPGELTEGEQPTATIVLEPMNQDTSGDEVAPLLVEYDTAT